MGGLAPSSQTIGSMDKLQLAGQNLGRVFNFRSGHMHAAAFLVLSVKLPNLQLKARHQTTSRFSPVSYRAPRRILIEYPLVGETSPKNVFDQLPI